MQSFLLHSLQHQIDEVEGLDLEGTSVRVTNLGEVQRLLEFWMKALGPIRPFYAIKCNNDPRILALLASLGTGFNRSTERDLARALELGCDPSNLTLTHPFKTRTLLALAREKNIQKLSFDTEEELQLVSELFPQAELLIRIATYKECGTQLNQSAFGIPHEQTDSYIALARSLNLSITGVSFHVEAEEAHPDIFQKSVIRAIGHTRNTIEKITGAGFKVSIIDIGGGFSENGLSETTSALDTALQRLIPTGVELIGEPGRLLVSSAVTIACKVIAKRSLPDGKNHALFINNSIYRNFANKIHDARKLEPVVLRVKMKYLDGISDENIGRESPARHIYSIHGSTTNTADTLVEGYYCHQEINCGDWICFPKMGAYSNSPNWEVDDDNAGHKMIYLAPQEAYMCHL